ncbi:MAG TPA: hemerythrin domain-containing protein [Alphaproteobacteria bacterium]|nr:hemerythrin domain-containing protein [Alphaproteobacteria bacterium]
MAAKSKSHRRPAKSLLDDLKQDHKEVKDLLKTILRSDDASEREETFAKMKVALTAHSEAEEEMFYPLLEEEEDSRTDALEAKVEHNIVKNLLEELEAMEDKTSDEWTAKCTVLQDLVEHHVEEEESQLFKDARKVLGKERLVELAGEFESAKESHMAQT